MARESRPVKWYSPCREIQGALLAHCRHSRHASDVPPDLAGTRWNGTSAGGTPEREILMSLNQRDIPADSFDLPVEMQVFYEALVERTDAIAREHDQFAIVPLMHELALCVASEGPSNADRRSTDEWARGIALTAVIAMVIDEPDEIDSGELRTVFAAAVGSDVDAAAQCTADVLMSAGVLDMGADWSLPS